jgi:outer membrane biosynthesis protein TonB
VKPAAKPTVKPTVKSSVKPAVKPAVKPKAVKKAKPVAKSPATAPAKSPAKSAKTVSPKPSTKPTVNKQATSPTKSLKDKKVKVVRDSFTIPKTELLQIGEMKKRALTLGVGVKKSELIRAGLSALSGMTDAAFKKALASVPTIKTGRPAKD